MAKKKNQQYLLRDKKTGLAATTDSATALFRRIDGEGDVEKGTVEGGAKKMGVSYTHFSSRMGDEKFPFETENYIIEKVEYFSIPRQKTSSNEN